MSDRRIVPFGRDISEIERNLSRLKDGGAGGTSGGVTDDWKDSVNTQLKQLHDDVRRLTGYIIAGAAVPLIAIFGLYMFVGQRSDSVSNRIAGVESRMTAIQIEQARQSGDLKLLLERTAPESRPTR